MNEMCCSGGSVTAGAAGGGGFLKRRWTRMKTGEVGPPEGGTTCVC